MARLELEVGTDVLLLEMGDALLLEIPTESVLASPTIISNWLHGCSFGWMITISPIGLETDLINPLIILPLTIPNIFQHPGDNSHKLHIITMDGAECLVESVSWDSGNKTANLKVKVPIISSSKDTILYLYYDYHKHDNSAIQEVDTLSGDNFTDFNLDYKERQPIWPVPH